MKKHCILFICLGICLHVVAQGDVAHAKYMHVTVDGNSSEWGSLNFYDDQTQLNFAIANDTANIYLCFVTGAQAAGTKLMRAGMKVTLSTRGKLKHEASIVFPLPQTNHPLHDTGFDKNNTDAAPGAQRVMNKQMFRQNYIAHHTTMQVSGFANANGEIPTNNTGIQAAINWDSLSNMVYEIAIAKNEFYGAGYSAKDLSGDITLSVELNGLSHAETGDAKYEAPHGEEMEGEDKQGSEKHEGALPPGVGFNLDKRPTGNDNMNNASLNQKTSFKQKFVLTDGSKN